MSPYELSVFSPSNSKRYAVRRASEYFVGAGPAREPAPGGVPGLAAHASGRAGGAVKPLTEAPVVDGIGACELRERARGGLALAGSEQRQHPESPDKRPDAAVVILIVEVLFVSPHIRPPQNIFLGDWRAGDTDRLMRIGARGADGVDNAVSRAFVGESKQDGEQVAKHVAFAAPE